ncbi:KCNQ5 [Acanthosepion pharaonis]|uniref:KCNQ5 n=1 Tax=Acanthosepion pharaonis TaxID=158019 RepID=A0A812B7I3_ACAPH|nr:KCNQ5 [Sepia pharaonis]
MSIATWKRHMTPCPSPSTEPRWKNNTSFVSRFSTRRRDRSSQVTNNVQSPMVPRQIRKAFMAGDEEISESLNRSQLSLSVGDQDHVSVRKESSISSVYTKESEACSILYPTHFFITSIFLSPLLFFFSLLFKISLSIFLFLFLLFSLFNLSSSLYIP